MHISDTGIAIRTRQILSSQLLILAGLAIVWIFSLYTPPARAAQTAEMDIAACFEGPASDFINKFAKQNTLAKNMYEMKAGSVCQEPAMIIIHECLNRKDRENNVDGESHYACIGKVANPCIDSAWGTNEFRRVVCVGTEEKVWLDILHERLDQMLKELPPAMAERAATMKKAFFTYRNEKCGLIRTLSGKSEPLLAYGACTTETVARFAIDLRESKPLIEKSVEAFERKQYPGNRQGAEKFLKRFLADKADRRGLTLKLRPRPEDYGAAYEQPLAGQLEKDHLALWSDPNAAIGPKKGQIDLLLTVTTSDKLKKGSAELAKFPGGYEKVLSYMKPGVPIARFKFVVPGESTGMAFDGLVHVNGRWVLIPKPWRSLN